MYKLSTVETVSNDFTFQNVVFIIPFGNQQINYTVLQEHKKYLIQENIIGTTLETLKMHYKSLTKMLKMPQRLLGRPEFCL